MDKTIVNTKTFLDDENNCSEREDVSQKESILHVINGFYK